MLSTILSILIVLFVVLLFFVALLIFRATVFGRLPPPVEGAEVESGPTEAPVVAEHLAAAIRVQTISDNDRSKVNLAAFDSLHATLERMYPRLHAALKREKINGHSLLYTWTGRADELEPVALLGHLDVVPVEAADREEWTHPPFAGTIAEGFIWGRGALDIKSDVIAIMEAVEGLIKAGYQPERTIYLAFGHDEETGGWQGARCIAKTLDERGVRLAALLDEGGIIADGMLPGVSLPVAVVGVAEKGHASVEMVVEGRSGHASMPPPHTAIGVLARAIARLEANPMPPRLSMALLMLSELGAFLPFSQRLALANSWLFRNMLVKRLQTLPTTNSMMRTTIAATLIQGGVKDNILPAQARAVVNCRLLPGNSVEMLLEHIRKVVNDEAVQVSLPEEAYWEPSPVSQVSSPVYQNLSRTIRQVFPEVLVAPYLTTTATDSRHYTRLCENVYRFSPYLLNNDQFKGIHGTDERLSVEGLARMVQFYHLLIKSWTTVVGSAE